MPHLDTLEARLKKRACELGFELAGMAQAAPADGFARLREWLDRGFAGEMGYMHQHSAARQHPNSVLSEVRSVVMVGMEYANAPSGEHDGRVARYAQGPDYHDELRLRLKELLGWVQREVPGCCGRCVVDTAPLLERDFASRAGLGWIGKNTMLINKRRGSYFVLGALLLDIALVPDQPHIANHCGTCTACIKACPTQAIVAPGWLDSRRCISYLTIELRGPIPEAQREGIGAWIFGCDVCQEVCPWNDKRPPGEAALPHDSELEALDPIALLRMSDSDFRERFRGTAIFRTKRRGLLRNAAIVLGNRGDPAALPALREALHDAELLVREAAQWAIERISAFRHHDLNQVAEQTLEHGEIGNARS